MRRLVFLFVLVLVLMEGIEKARREGRLFCICQWVTCPLDFFVLTFFSSILLPVSKLPVVHCNVDQELYLCYGNVTI